MSLQRKAISGLIWTFTQQVGVQGINFIVQIILARLLLPEVFGLIAMIHVFMAIGTALMDSGMTSSLIRTKNTDQSDYSTVFFINFFSSIIIYLVLFFTAPYIALFFDQPLLSSIVRVYTLSFIIQALLAVQSARLTKEMNFKLQMYMQIPSSIIGGTIGIVMAYKGFGVWSLVWMHLVTTFLFMIQHWFRTDWKPSLIFDKQKFKYHFGFGYKLTFSALITAIYHNSYTLVIGKFFSPTQLGFYNQANTLRIFPVRNINAALQKVTYPLFSSIQDDNKKLKSVFKRITSIVFYVTTPIMFFLTCVAEPLFRVILTDKWLPAVPFFQILCVSTIFYPQSIYNLNIIVAKGRSDLHLKLEVLKKGLSVLFLLLIIPYGIWGVIYAQAIGLFIHFYFNSLYSGRMINYFIKEQVKDFLPILSLNIIILIIVYILDYLFMNYILNNDVYRIIISFFTYFGLLFTISYGLRLKPLLEMKNLLKSYNFKT